MKLSVKSEYACLALVYLGREYAQKRVVSIAEIARSQNIPKKFLEQILLSLKRAGYVRSVKGAHGGYSLARTPGAISIAEIVRCLDGALAPVDSVSRYFFAHTPIEKSRKLLTVFRRIRDYISDTLENVTIADVI